MKKLTILTTAILITTLYATVINVPADQPTIQAGIDAAVSNPSVHRDTVLVAPGVYHENINYNGKNIIVGSYFLITQDTSYISNTCIVWIEELGYHTHDSGIITFENGENSTAVLEGITIAGVPFTTYPNLSIYCGPSASPTIKNNINPNGGHGIVLHSQSNMKIVGNKFIQSGCQLISFGVGIADDASAIVINNRFINNFIDIYIGNNCTSLINRNVTAGAKWCSIRVDALGTNVIMNNTISADTFSEDALGAGIYLHAGNSRPFLINNIIYSVSYVIETNSFGGYQPVFINNCLQESLPNYAVDLGGNIYEDPLFTNPANGDYTLQSNSPCIDAGTAFFVWEGDTLVNLSEDEYFGEAPDMGAFEYEGTNSTEPIDPTPTDFVLKPAYPNPFNPTTTITCEIPQESHVVLTVYDLMGRKVKELVNKNGSSQI